MPTMTAAQKRAQAKVDYDAFLAGCPSRQLLDRISDKWVALILAALGSDGPHPRGRLRRRAAVDALLRAVPPAGRGQPEDAHPDAALPRARRPASPAP